MKTKEEIVNNWLPRYTGMALGDFGEYILLCNFSHYVELFAEWNQVFPSAACLVTLIDRLVHRAEIVPIEGESYRLKEAQERNARKTAARVGRRRKTTP